MDDLISRQAALGCFRDWIDSHGDVHTADEMAEYQAIEALPSALPKPQLMYDELVRELRGTAQWAEGNAHAPVMRRAADAIEELSRENESLAKSVNEATELLHKRRTSPKWIPVADRLPEEDGKYLTACKINTIPPIPWIEVCWFAKNLCEVDKYNFPKKKPGFYKNDSEYGYFEVSGITHWMPLPSAPTVE